MKLSEKDRKVLLKAQRGEMNGVLMYRALADAIEARGGGSRKAAHDAATFRQLASEEGGHAAVFRGLTGETVQGQPVMGRLLVCMFRLLGRRRLYPLIAKGEYAALKTYQPVAERFPEVWSVRSDEKRHGDTVMGLLD